MPLTLTVTAAEEVLRGTPNSMTFDRRGGTIGRGADNDWALPDARRHLSTRHCTIAFADGRYTITDTSSNGVYLNDAPEPLGPGNTADLQDGDHFSLSNYTIAVQITGDEAAATVAPPWSAPRAMDTPHHAPQPEIDTDPFGLNPKPPPHPTAGAVSHPPAEAKPADPVTALLPEDVLAPPGAARPIIPEDIDLLGDPPRSAFADVLKDYQGAAESDHIPAERVAYQPPAVMQEPVVESSRRNDAPAVPTVKLSAPPTPAAPASHDALLHAFLEGAGLLDLDLKGQDPAETMRNLGHVFREAVQGIRVALASRSMVKGELRIQQTVIRPGDNNPLKFSASVEEALTALIGRPWPGYLPPVEAVRDGFNDLKAHELALLAGLQAVLTAVLRQFDPQALKQRLDQQSSLGTLLPAMRKAKYWELYEVLHQQVSSEVKDNFDTWFGREFARAYTEQIKKF